MKAIFLDIDGVLQPCGRENCFKHIKNGELPGVCLELNQRVTNGLDLCEFCGGNEEDRRFKAEHHGLSAQNCDVAAVLGITFLIQSQPNKAIVFLPAK